MACRPQALAVEVYDSSSARPVLRTGDAENGGGLGWGIVKELTEARQMASGARAADRRIAARRAGHEPVPAPPASPGYAP
ncbi:hypothetical protein PV721_26790 [Streptomyces sp. MB09-01]|uniref:hypothetical protein n=1 Tax=Streptomyces sp. MB09-01 TaxID=3028666 RepID=UPI0029AEA49F|nr:hypothetical protein [Streptomyces sp. MB09-01]MDX3537894.1 hypothetical protein [Streptomyces sp. MB09-01]